jgi:hypothetical protein
VPSLGLEPATKGVCSAAACMLTTTPSRARGERKEKIAVLIFSGRYVYLRIV